MAEPAVLEVEDLKTYFRSEEGIVRAVDGVSFEVRAGRTLGIVGESGCGKSTLARAIVRLIEPNAGTIRFDQHDITHLTPDQLRPLRRGFQMIFQDPNGSLDPRMRVADLIAEGLDLHHLTPTPAERAARVESLLQDVGLDPTHINRMPASFSGGQRQRIGIARALAVEPKLLVCDEPVSALDVSIQAQIVNLLQDLQQRRNLALLFIGHDLAVVEHISQRMLVLYLGQVLESGPASELCRTPAHPYTQALLSAAPDPTRRRKRLALPGEPPSPLQPPAGCPFHPRCPLAEPRCRLHRPELLSIAPGRHAACHLLTRPT